MYLHFTLWKEDTSLMRTHLQGLKIDKEHTFHLLYMYSTCWRLNPPSLPPSTSKTIFCPVSYRRFSLSPVLTQQVPPSRAGWPFRPLNPSSWTNWCVSFRHSWKVGVAKWAGLLVMSYSSSGSTSSSLTPTGTGESCGIMWCHVINDMLSQVDLWYHMMSMWRMKSGASLWYLCISQY